MLQLLINFLLTFFIHPFLQTTTAPFRIVNREGAEPRRRASGGPADDPPILEKWRNSQAIPPASDEEDEEAELSRQLAKGLKFD